MSLHTNHSSHSQLAFMGWFRRPSCPSCNDMLFAATETKLAGEGLILYTWCCENCSHEFRTAVEFPAPQT